MDLSHHNKPQGLDLLRKQPLCTTYFKHTATRQPLLLIMSVSSYNRKIFFSYCNTSPERALPLLFPVDGKSTNELGGMCCLLVLVTLLHKCKNSTSNISADLKIEAHQKHMRCSVLKNTHRLRSFCTEAL